ncbi:MAG: hypothetical protein HY332_08735, partial [Chloroflexi bacterium]|nr:hypothetical protein [Chloroflexota bacterium]
MTSSQAEGELAPMGPVARMMMSVAGHAITSYVQFRALAELLIAKGVITREELENRFVLMRERELERTIDEWFTPDIAYHLKMAVQSAMAQEAATESGVPAEPGQPGQPDEPSVGMPEPDEMRRARMMQAGGTM